MHDLAGRLDAIDPAAAQAIRVMQHFDQLTTAGVGLLSLLRSAADLAGCPVGLVHPGRVAPLVVGADGVEADFREIPVGACPVPGVSGASVWLERSGPAVFSDPYVIDRLAAAVSTVLSRTTTTFTGGDAALVEILVDRARPTEVRHSAAARLGLSAAPFTVMVTLAEAGPIPRRSARLGPLLVVLTSSGNPDPALPTRAAWASAGSLIDLPAALDDARAALRLTAGPGELGATRIAAADLGALKLVAQSADSSSARQEIGLVHRAVASSAWVENTVIAMATCDSLRAAATLLGVHHSTLQQRAVTLEGLLGYSVQTMDGRMRAYLAIMLWRAHVNSW